MLALFAAAAAHGTSTTARVWLATPTTVAGSGFPTGKVTVTARLQDKKAVRIVRASRTGHFTARFDSAIKPNGCQGVSVSAVGENGVRAAIKMPGNAKDCPPPIQQ